MSPMTFLLILLILALSSSGFFLKYTLHFKTSLSSCMTPLWFALVGIGAVTQLRSFNEAIGFFLAAIAQFAAFVFVSRLRQRGSFFWHTVAAVASNITWYVTMHILSGSKAYWMLIIPHILGIVVGRTTGSSWAQYIEQKFNLKSDATRDDRLAPGKRLALIKNEPAFWLLSLGLIVYIIYSYFGLGSQAFKSAMIVVGLGLLQNFFYAIYSRATARGNNWYIASTSILAGVTFYLSTVYLFSQGMSLRLLLPYTLATTLGSTTGAFFSMIIEWVAKIAPDIHIDGLKGHVQKNKSYERIPYVILIVLALMWAFFQEPLFHALGYPVSPLQFPVLFSGTVLPRALIILISSLIFLLDEALHTINSRAGNRNHTGYHVATCIPKGLMNFSKISYIAQNSRLVDVLPVGILASCLGALYAKAISERLERWLQARMDILPENKKSPPAAAPAK